MIIPNKYKAINWADGMKISKEHFSGMENFFIDQLRDAVSFPVNSFNFGQLPPLAGSGALVSDFQVLKSTTNQISIVVNEFHAVTPGGVKIHIAGETLQETLTLPDAEDEEASVLNTGEARYFYVVLIANPHEKVAIGNPDPEEIPIRQPFTKPEYKLQLVAVNSINFQELGAYHLIIGRIRKNGNDISRDESFIPPCTSVVSHDKLKQHYHSTIGYLSDIQNLAQQIVQKINFKNTKTGVAQNIKTFCTVVLNYFAEYYFSLRNILPQQPPVHLVNAMANFSNQAITFINILPEAEKEEMLNYFFEWSDITPVAFIDKLSNVIDINYNHHYNGVYFAAISAMLNNVLVVLQRLNTLEYIGLKKENIVVKEEVLAKVNKDRKGWNILD